MSKFSKPSKKTVSRIEVDGLPVHTNNRSIPVLDIERRGSEVSGPHNINVEGNLTDSTLNAIRQGEEIAWTSLHSQLAGSLQMLAHKKIDRDLRMRVSPSDIVQDTFFLAHRSASSFRGRSLEEVFAWIKRIFSNRLKRVYRDQKDTLKRSVRRETRLHGMRRYSSLVGDENTPSGVVQENEERELLDQAFRLLSEADRMLIVDHHVKGLSFGEIACMSGRTEIAIRKHWSRAIVRWRDCTNVIMSDVGHRCDKW